ncbi:MAG: dipeptide epimerase [Cytophagaceae bacterium]|nr:dipeptide epimerase [Cytophagaceae bacterium]MBL0301847.1 dipeptide epimerase [Cytophagaceae bacterium]MBL0324673.1 dipeptide epimerase [Cytophagaceae bacterium]
MNLKTHIFTLKSRYPFKIAHGTRLETKTFVVEISENGISGLGEATPVPYYGISTDDLLELTKIHRNAICQTEWNHPAELWEKLNPLIGQNHFLQCALDIAAYDLWAKKQNLPLYKALGLNISKIPFSDYTIGIDEISVMIKKMKEYDFPIYKIKLGTPDDIEIIKALRKETDAVFRVDANTGWEVAETIRNSEELAKLGVEFIEQPLKADRLEEMIEVKKASKLPIVADESCIIESDVEKCTPYFDGVNIKLAKCGGITPALRMIKIARKNNLKVMMGCMTETSIGISAIAHLLPLLDYVDMDGAMLIANDPAEGVKVEKGKAIFKNLPGLGVVLK